MLVPLDLIRQYAYKSILYQLALTADYKLIYIFSCFLR